MKYYSKEQLEDLGIYELRYLAREKGVKSPTTKKRDELILSIINIQDGVEKPAQKSRQGRPAKRFEFGSSKLTQNSICVSEDAFKDVSSVRFTFSSPYAPYNKTEEVQELEIAGYLVKYNGHYCLLGFDNPMAVEILAITDEMNVKKYNLVIGDYVFCKCKFTVGTDLPILEEVITVNSQPVTYSIRELFKLLKPSFDKKQLICDKYDNNIYDSIKELKSSDKVLIKFDDSTSLKSTLKDISTVLCDSTEVVTVFIGATPEDVNYYQNNLKSTIFFFLFTDSYEQQKYLYDLALEYSKNQVASGKDVVLIVHSLSTLEMVANKNIESADSIEPLMVKSLYSLARNTQKNSSLTVVGLIENEEDFIIQTMLPYIDIIIENK